MLQDWQGKTVVVTVAHERVHPIEGVLMDVQWHPDLGVHWVEVDVTTGRPGLVRIAVDQIVTARLVGE